MKQLVLRMPVNKAYKQLSTQIDKGYNLLARKYETQYEKYQFETEHDIWVHSTLYRLDQIFSTGEVFRDLFGTPWVCGPIPPVEPDHLDMELKRLESIRRRVELGLFPVEIDTSGSILYSKQFIHNIYMTLSHQLYRAIRLLDFTLVSNTRF